MKRRADFGYLLCDLDDTLYPTHLGLMKAVGERINRFMIDQLDIPATTAPQLRSYFYERYGTSMRGLMLHYGINPEIYLEYVHDLPLTEFIEHDPLLDAMLGRICLRKVIVTNASREHALRVLDMLRVSHHFERILDIRDFGFHSKPHRAAYQRSLKLLGAQPAECILVEDSARNIAPARAMGMLSVWVRSAHSGVPPGADVADLCIDDILQLADTLQPLIGC
jgi:putative hydrolase of the HAD superfamily